MTKPLADVAKAEEARREAVKKPSKVITNKDLRPDISKGSPGVTTVSPVTDSTPANASPAAPAGAATPAAGGAKQDQAYWGARMKEARDKVTRSQLFADSLQTRINSLTTDFVNRDDPAQRAKIETDRQTALAELDKVKKEIAEETKAITAIQDEARRAGVPVGWVR
jgi:3-oxoacyl-ACP reductase-like protein